MMRAKMQVISVTKYNGATETIKFQCVSRSTGYPKDGSDEDNSFALWTPSGLAELQITNPALHGKLIPGRKFYVDFTEAGD